jgi:hypothetical protein
MKTAKMLAAMLLLPTLAMAQTPNVDPSLRRVHEQTIGFSSGQGAGVPGGNTLFMLVSPPINITAYGTLSEQFVAQTSAVSGIFKNLYITQIGGCSGPCTGTYTWRINGVSTGITCTATNAGGGSTGTCSDLTHTATITAGQSYDLQTVGSGNIVDNVYGGIELDTP